MSVTCVCVCVCVCMCVCVCVCREGRLWAGVCVVGCVGGEGGVSNESYQFGLLLLVPRIPCAWRLALTC